MKIGLLGFGEVGFHFAQGFVDAGLLDVIAYSPSAAKASPGDPLHARAAAARVRLVATPREVCAGTDVIIAVPPGKAALQTLRSVRRYLHPHQIYVDASTPSVKAMEQAGRMLEGRAGFVDAAIMAPVSPEGIRVAIMASGSHAAAFEELMVPYGMNISVVGDKAGAATAMKLIRSVTMKGFAALLLESLEAAERYGIRDAVAADTTKFFDGRPFEQIMKRFVCGTVVHAQRRVHEMSESIELLRTLKMPARMTRATRAVLLDVARMGLRERFRDGEPTSIAPVIEAMASARDSEATPRQPEQQRSSS